MWTPITVGIVVLMAIVGIFLFAMLVGRVLHHQNRGDTEPHSGD